MAKKQNRAGVTPPHPLGGVPLKGAAFWQGYGPLAAVLIGALLLRVALVLLTDAYLYDEGTMFAWALRMADGGPAGFYAADYFADYPPGYMLVLWLVGGLMRAFGLAYTQKSAALLMAAVPILCELGLAALIYAIAQKYAARRTALWLAALAAFCPAFLFDSAVWRQIDGVLCLCMAGAFWLLEQKRYLPAAFLYGVGLAVKPQPLLLGPVLAVCFLRPLLAPGPSRGAAPEPSAQNSAALSPAGRRAARLRAVKNGALGALAALAPVLAAALPFGPVSGLPALLAQKYLGTAQSYPYAAINACNLYAALGANWKSQTERFGPLTWQQWGGLGILLVTGYLVYLAVRSSRAGRFSPLLLAGVYLAGIFTLSHRMHERYLLPAIALLLAAAAVWDDRRLVGLSAGFSLTATLNQALVYSSAGTDDEFLTSAASALMLRFTGLCQLALFLLLAFTAYDLAVKGHVCRFAPAPPLSCAPPAPLPPWTAKERLALAGLTLAAAAVGLFYLGEHTAPETLLDASGTTLTETAATEGQAAEAWVYPAISYGGRLTITDLSGAVLAELELNYGTTFQWKRLALAAAPADGRYIVTVENASVAELAFRDSSGALLPLSQAGGQPCALFDEQQKVPDTISQLNSMYFDEIYHGRTGYEHLHRLPVYETTHPPLGKVFIMLGIALFGMNGFGWRVAGALFGAGMVPVLYLLARRLFKRPWLAFTAAALFALDTLRFSQSRIATIDVYGTFFILLSAYFMVWYCQSVLQNGVTKSLLPMALAGAAFGLGAASKWTGIYAGAGLAVLYFGALYVRFRQKQPGFRRELAAALAGGVVCFVLLPLALYIGSYGVYRVRDAGFGLAEWWQCQLTMFRYHAGLESTHPFESRWYTWPLLLRPVWYYMGHDVAEGAVASIAGLGSPVVFWAGLAAVCWLGVRQVCGRGSRVRGALLVFWLAQMLPWTLVTRCTFLYHYLPCLGFSVLAIAAFLAELEDSSAQNARLARRLAGVLLAAALAVFLWFYPAVSGLPVPEGLARSILWLPSWGFYQLKPLFSL